VARQQLGRISAMLRIGKSEVTFTVGGKSYTQTTGGPTLAARELLRQLGEPLEDWRSGSTDGGPQADDPADALKKAGQALGMSFLEGPAGLALARELSAAEAAGTQLQLAIDASGDFADLPWETLILPERCDPSPGRRPLGLDPRVAVYRTAGGGERPLPRIPSPVGPPRILAAIGCPERGGMSLLNYEHELRTILDAVSLAGQEPGAEVRILNWGTVGAVRAALAANPAHILHISCHAEPGRLCLETPTGEEDLVDAERMIGEMVPPDSMIPPLIVLAGCSTSRDVRHGTGSPALPGLARGLVSAGAPAVIAMTGAVSDGYATRFAGEIYNRLASEPDTDLAAAFAAVRRLLAEEADRESKGASPEWHIPAIFLRDPLCAVLSSAGSPLTPSTPSRPTTPAREAGSDPADYASYFVGRRAELRDVLSSFQTGSARVLVCGMSGIGKTSFINAVIAMLEGAAGIPVRISADQRPEQIVAAVIAEWERATSERGAHDQTDLAVTRREPSWPGGFARIREQVLVHQPVTLVLEVGDADLVAHGDSHALANPDLAVFLAAWTAYGRGAALLGASPRPFKLPGGPASQPEVRFLGPLSDAETLKLAFQLPAVRAKDADDVFFEQLPRLSGHPRAVVRLNSMLAEGPQRELADAVTDAISAEAEAAGIAIMLAGLDADSALLRLVTGAGVYRLPVDRVGMNWQLAGSLDPAGDPEQVSRLTEFLGTPEPSADLSPQLRRDLADQRRPADDPRLAGALRNGIALGLISGPFNPDGAALARFKVPQFIAESILPGTHHSVIAEANRRAAAYWRWSDHVASSDDTYDITDTWRIEEALYHLYRAGDEAGSLDVAADLVLPALFRGGAADARLVIGLGSWLARAAADPSRELCGVRLALGSAYCTIGKLDQGVHELSGCISTARALGDDLLVVAGSNALARILAITGQTGELISMIAESGAEEAAERADDDVLRAAVLMMRAPAAVMSGEFDMGITLAEQALALCAAVTRDRPFGRAEQQYELALIAETLSQPATATTTRQQGDENFSRGALAVDTELTAHCVIASAALMVGRVDDADYHASRAIEAAAAFPFAGSVARACQAKGLVHLSRNELSAAEEMCRAALRDPAADYAGVRAVCYALLSDVAQRQGNTAASAERLEKAISAAERMGNTLLAGFYCAMRASLSIELEDGNASEWLERAEASGAGDHPLVRMTAAMASAQQKFYEDEYAAADQFAREALSWAREGGFQPQILQALRLLAFNALSAEDEDTFEWAAEELEAATESSGDMMAALMLLVLRFEVGMKVASSEEEWDEVAELVQEALGIAEEIGANQVIAICLERLLTISVKRRAPGEIASPAQRLLAVSQTIDDPSGVLRSIEGSILAAIDREDLDAIREQVQWHHAYADGTPAECNSLVFEGMFFFVSGDVDSAEDIWRRALAMAMDAGQFAMAGLAADNLADVAEERGDLALAEAYLAQVLSLAAPDEYDVRFVAFDRMREISVQRAAAEPGYPWWEALSRLAESADETGLSAACYQVLGEIAADRKEERQAELWLRKSLELWADSVDRDISLGRKAARRRLAMMIAYDPDRWEDVVTLVGRNVAESLHDNLLCYPVDTMLLQTLRGGMSEEKFMAALSVDPAERAAILSTIF
jgi:tetratricopeptide (TPR) repeat protein